MNFEELLQLLLGQTGTGTPVKTDVSILVTRDSEGHPTLEIVGGETVVLGQEESINRMELAQDTFFSCGCPRSQSEIGARCICGRISCAIHTSRCANPNCRQPLCISCVTHVVDAEGNTIPFCEADATEIEWKSLVHRATLGLIPPARF